MNKDKLKELQERLILVVADQSRFSIECTELSDLINYVRQLEKDNAELLAALKNIQGELFDFAILFNVALLEIPNHKKQITDYIDKIENMAFKIINKHKGE